VRPLVRLLLISFVLSPVSFAQGHGQGDKGQSTRDAASVARWVDGIDGRIAAYYGPAASDERVRAFLGWVRSNRETLLAVYRKDLTERRVPNASGNGAVRVFAFWLGIRYAADRYRRAPEQRFPPIVIVSPPRERSDFIAAYDSVDARFEFARQLTAPVPDARIAVEFVRRLNLGVHEGAHALPFVNGGTGLLSELGVYSVQTELALPLASRDAEITDAYRLGTRHFPEVAAWFSAEVKRSNRAVAPDYLEAEYLSFVLGPWLRGSGPPLDALAYPRDGDTPEFTLQELFENAADRGRPARTGAGDSSAERSPTDLDVVVAQFCLEAGIADDAMQGKVRRLVAWIDACFAGSAEERRFATLADALERLRRYAKATGQRRVASPPATVVRDRALFLDFLTAMQKQLGEIFGPPARRPLPPGFV
jgi:hypothetical protein